MEDIQLEGVVALVVGEGASGLGIVNKLVDVCEGAVKRMMCAFPYVKDSSGPKDYSKEGRAAATPFPCGRCLPCKINKAREWQSRLLLELQVSECGCFVTLTYDDDHIGLDWSLDIRDYQLFLKKLRKRLNERKIRYFLVGEYGDNNDRPHFHIALFNVSIADQRSIEASWPHGFIAVGDLNKNSARYITGYCIKKMTKKDDPRLKNRSPEFMRSSKMKGGIGYPAIKKMAEKLKKENWYSLDEVIRTINIGKNGMPLGRYLTKKLAEETGISQNVLDKELKEYQDELFKNHNKKEKHYYWSIVAEKENERLSQKKRHKIYKQKRSL